MLVLKGIFGGSLKITSENRNNFWGKKSPQKILRAQWQWSPPAPGSLKAPLLPSLLNNVQTRERKGYERGTARNFPIHFHCPVPRSSSHIGHGKEVTLWHEIITKITPWELFFVIFQEFCPLEMSRKDRHFRGITREIRNFSENNYFRIIFRK